MNINDRGKVSEKGSISGLSHSQFSFAIANTFCPQKLSCMESITLQLLVSVFTGSCHLLLRFNDRNTAEPVCFSQLYPQLKGGSSAACKRTDAAVLSLFNVLC